MSKKKKRTIHLVSTDGQANQAAGESCGHDEATSARNNRKHRRRRGRKPQRGFSGTSIIPLAELLHLYLQHRAEVEGVDFALPLSYFQGAVILCRIIFGVEHDGERLLRDHRECSVSSQMAQSLR